MSETFYYKPLPGMNSKAEELELEMKAVKTAQNCRFEGEPGTVEKRPPVSYYNASSMGDGAVVGLYRYYKSDGTKEWIAVHGTTVYAGDDTTGTFSAIRTLSNSGKRMSFVTYKDLAIGGNGYDEIFVYDGDVTWELGSCKAEAVTSGSITKTSVSYCITFYDGASEYVSGAVSNELDSLSSEDVDLTNIPLGDTTITARKIYRKDSSTGGGYKLVDTISDNSTTTYTDSEADVSGNAAMPTVTDAMPKGAKLKMHRERLHITKDPNYPNRVYVSEAYLPHYILTETNTDYLEISPEDNDEIVGFPIQNTIMYAIKKNSIRPVHVSNPVSGLTRDDWYADDPIAFQGCPAPWTIQQTPYGIVYLGWDHWYVCNGSNVQPIIDAFDVSDILDSRYAECISYYANDVLVCAYTDNESATTQNHNRVMRYNFKRKALSYDTLDVNCFAARNGGGERNEVFLGDSLYGYVYRYENAEITYSLLRKSQIEEGSIDNVFIGGTEAAPYIELGSTTAALAIPEDLCIFWDNYDEGPGTGWTEVDFDTQLILINSTAGTESDGEEGSETNDKTFSTYKIYKKNSSTTEYQFPLGAIVMWGEGTAPEGWQVVTSASGGGEEGDFVLGYDGAWLDDLTIYNLDSVSFTFIKKIGEESTWDGVEQYCYCLYDSASTPGSGWTIDSTYNDRYLKFGAGQPSTSDWE